MKFAPVKTAIIGCGMISDTYLQNLIQTFSIIDVVGCADGHVVGSAEIGEFGT